MVKKTGIIQEETLQSKELGADMTILIYLPVNYSPLYTYHVIIAQDGHDYFRLGKIGRQAEELMQNKEMERSIIIGVPYESVTERRNTYHPDGTKFEAYKRFLANELIPYIDKHYPTYQIGSGRTFIGDSLGATISLMTAIDYPSLFGGLILQSPYVDESVLEAVKQSTALSHYAIIHQIGLEETAVKTTDGQVLDFVQPNEDLKALLEQTGADYLFETFEGDHKWTFWQPLIAPSLKRMLPYSLIN
ncbi:esterase family protein [Bacillus safensis]|uniref:alpha/beta hydrolase n=1 Tax=Bacillus safensis TaxID=561879 RepID=UPI0020752B4F|nr:esterase family protein [Bacillus safensis]USD83912.1 esterase family protein [Bacillus safensis]